MNAVSDPICMSPLLTRPAPNHSTPTVDALRMTMTMGKISAWRRPTASAVPVSVVFAPANRASSKSSRTKARTTRIPVICSRMIRLTLSMDVCMIRNCGIIRRITRPTASASRGTATATSQDRPTSCFRAMTMPPTMLIGAETMRARAMKTTIWIWVTSLVLREMRVGAPNLETS